MITQEYTRKGKKSPGRPINPNSLHKTGKQLHLWINKKDFENLNQVCKNLEISVSQLIRSLVKQYKE